MPNRIDGGMYRLAIATVTVEAASMIVLERSTRLHKYQAWLVLVMMVHTVMASGPSSEPSTSKKKQQCCL
jgi:hypothetical protein